MNLFIFIFRTQEKCQDGSGTGTDNSSNRCIESSELVVTSSFLEAESITQDGNVQHRVPTATLCEPKYSEKQCNSCCFLDDRKPYQAEDGKS